MKTFTNLKKDLIIGKGIKMTYNKLFNDRTNNLLNKVRYIIKIQTNGVYLSEDKNASKGSFLEFPPASLISYDGETLKIYEPILRELTTTEKSILDNEPSNRKENEQLSINDVLTDGSQTYWMDKKYYNDLNANWRWGEHKGLRYDINNRKMWDNKILGDLSLQYTIIK